MYTKRIKSAAVRINRACSIFFDLSEHSPKAFRLVILTGLCTRSECSRAAKVILNRCQYSPRIKLLYLSICIQTVIITLIKSRGRSQEINLARFPANTLDGGFNSRSWLKFYAMIFSIYRKIVE